jgi:hypothetical protein
MVLPLHNLVSLHTDTVVYIPRRVKNDSQNADLTTRGNRTAVLSTAAVLAVFTIALQALKMLAIAF